ncbi:excise, DNA binding domain, excisionase family [Acidimicrobiia bacterium]
MSERQKTEWLSSSDAAELLGIGTRTLYRFIDEGRLPAYRFGRVIRLQRHEVESFVSSCRIEPGSLDHLHPELVASEISPIASSAR